jgi:hypothetical protein
MKLRSLSAAVLGGALAISGPTAAVRADTFNVSFFGIGTYNYPGQSGNLTFNGFYNYDSNLPDSQLGDPSYGLYHMPQQPGNFFVSWSPLTSPPQGPAGGIFADTLFFEIRDGNPGNGFYDAYGVTGEILPQSTNGQYTASFRLTFVDLFSPNYQNWLTSDALVAPDLHNFDFYPYVSVGQACLTPPCSGIPNTSWVGNIVTLTITDTTTPLPATLPLFTTGLGAFGLLGWRKRRKAIAA